MNRFYVKICNVAMCIAMFFSISTAVSAQPRDRNYIKQQIANYGECRNVAITKSNGDLMLYAKNGYATSGCPDDLVDALDKLNDDEELIDDVQLTENGRWLILYGDNGFQWNNIPKDLEKALREYNSDGEVVTSVSFNDAGDWIIITTEHFSASDSEITKWLKDGQKRYGQIWTTCITDDAMVAVYENGYICEGDVPKTLEKALKKTSIDVYRLKIAGNAWFMSDGQKDYDYNM